MNISFSIGKFSKWKKKFQWNENKLLINWYIFFSKRKNLFKDYQKKLTHLQFPCIKSCLICCLLATFGVCINCVYVCFCNCQVDDEIKEHIKKIKNSIFYISTNSSNENLNNNHFALINENSMGKKIIQSFFSKKYLNENNYNKLFLIFYVCGKIYLFLLIIRSINLIDRMIDLFTFSQYLFIHSG